MDENEDGRPLTVGEFNTLGESLVAQLNESFTTINKTFEEVYSILGDFSGHFVHIHKRLDDIDRRLEKLGSRSDTMAGDISTIKSDMHSVRNDTRLIPQMLDMFKIDGGEVVQLRNRVANWEAYANIPNEDQSDKDTPPIMPEK